MSPAERAGRPLRVLFVCTANICRSPTMELLARAMLEDAADVELSSAGTHGWVDQPVSEEMAVVLTERGLDHSGFRSRPLERSMLLEADLVLTAEASHRSYLLADQPGLFRKVLTLGQLAAALDRVGHEPLTRAELLARVGELRGHPDPAYDVVDPYRRGPAAARTAAEHIERLLQRVVPALSSARPS